MMTERDEPSPHAGKQVSLRTRVRRMIQQEAAMTMRAYETKTRTREDDVVALLDHMLARIGTEALGVMVVGTDGLVLAARLHDMSSQEQIGAVAATIYGVTQRVSLDLKQSSVTETIVESARGFILVRPISHEAVLTIDLSAQANLGMARLEARRMVPRLHQVLE